jgi:hypothetical protein
MQNRAEEMRRWWAAIEPIRNLTYLKLKSIDDFLVDLGLHGKTDTVDGIVSFILLYYIILYYIILYYIILYYIILYYIILYYIILYYIILYNKKLIN